MDLGLVGTRAVVIGGTSGLGLAAATTLAAEGADLVVFARNAERVAGVAQRLGEEHGINASGVTGDITQPSDVRSLAAATRAAGGAQVLVLNTPRPPSPMRDFLDETEDARWEAAYRDQLQAALSVLREMAPIVAESGAGRIIGITSASVKEPLPRHAISSIFRAGVAAALKHLANELAPRGTTVNAVAPATVLTPTFSTFHDLEARVRAVPLGKPGEAEDLGAVVAFLASRQAGFITGQTIQFDGGRTGSLL